MRSYTNASPPKRGGPTLNKSGKPTAPTHQQAQASLAAISSTLYDLEVLLRRKAYQFTIRDLQLLETSLHTVRAHIVSQLSPKDAQKFQARPKINWGYLIILLVGFILGMFVATYWFALPRRAAAALNQNTRHWYANIAEIQGKAKFMHVACSDGGCYDLVAVSKITPVDKALGSR